MKIHLRESQDDISYLPIASYFSATTNVVTHRLLQEQASLTNQQMQDLYSPPPGSYTAPSGSITAPPPGQEPVTPISYQSVLTDQFSAMANIIQRREQDLQNHEQQMLT